MPSSLPSSEVPFFGRFAPKLRLQRHSGTICARAQFDAEQRRGGGGGGRTAGTGSGGGGKAGHDGQQTADGAIPEGPRGTAERAEDERSVVAVLREFGCEKPQAKLAKKKKRDWPKGIVEYQKYKLQNKLAKLKKIGQSKVFKDICIFPEIQKF